MNADTTTGPCRELIVPGGALAALRLRSNIYAREAVTGLLPRVRRDTAAGRELHGIAYRMGLNDRAEQLHRIAAAIAPTVERSN